jgi:hypothetical protein
MSINLQDISPGNIISINDSIFLVLEKSFDNQYSCHKLNCVNINDFNSVKCIYFKNISEISIINNQELLNKLNKKLIHFKNIINKIESVI